MRLFVKIFFVLRHALFTFSVIISRLLTLTFLVSLLFMLIYQLSVMDNYWLTGFISLALVIVYPSLASFITHFIESIFFHSHYDRRDVLAKIKLVLLTEPSLGFLKSKLVEVLSKELRSTAASFLLLDNSAAKLPSLSPVVVSKFEDPRLQKLIHIHNEILLFEELKDPVLIALFQELDIEVVVPLHVQDEAIGILILGPKHGHGIYTSRDLAFLNAFRSQAAISLKNAGSYLQLQEFSKTMETKIIERTRQLEESQAKELKLKDEFVFIATHDLATPVTAISGFTAMINARGEAISNELKNNLAAITEASARLKVLVNDLLFVARSDSGTIKVELTAVDVRVVIEAAIRQFDPQIKAKNIELELALCPQVMIQADSRKLSEIIENLLSNGIKYNRDGGKIIISSVMVNDELELSVSDTGLGISLAEQKLVFSKFFRSDEPEIRSLPGTGLGLFVVRMLTEKMGGSISFDSVPNSGTTFKLRFRCSILNL